MRAFSILNPRNVGRARAVILFAASITAGIGLTTDGRFPGGAALALVGALYALVTAYEPRSEQTGSSYRYVTAVGDAVLVSAITWATGGVTSEYYLLYFLPVVVAAARLDFRSGIVACIAVGCVYPLALLGAPAQESVLPMPVVRSLTVFVGALVVALLFLLLARETKLADDLRTTLHNSLRRVAAVYEVAHAANTGADLTAVLTIILDHAARATQAANGSLFLMEETGALKPMVSLFTASKSEEGAAHPPMGPALEALRRSKPVITSVPQADGGRAEAAVYVPLGTTAGAIGVLALVAKQGREFGRRHLDFLTSVCSEAALAVENAQLRTELKRLAVTDPLTGLPNRREVERQLAVELERSLRYHRPLSVMMVDLDNLKEVNDVYGHAAGDEVLTALARMIQQGVRSSEIVGRIGGDEFLVVLPETEPWQAEALAQRLIYGLAGKLREWPRIPEVARLIEAVGMSVGIAGGDEGAVTPDRLVARADAALYEAKRAGKNRFATALREPALR